MRQLPNTTRTPRRAGGSKAGLTALPRGAAPFALRLVVMVKQPTAGRVKTRLARDVGIPRAVGFYRSTTAAVLTRLSATRRWRTLLSVAPDTAVRASAWPLQVPRVPQGTGDLGQRMQRIMDRMPPGPVVIVGSDIPGIERHHIAEAFRLLGRNEAVLGPAGDGGYWLVGFRRSRRIPRPFTPVRWSQAETLDDTLGNLGSLPVALATTVGDVDSGAELARGGGVHGRRVRPVAGRAQPR